MNNPLESLLYPKSIALAGATNNPTKMGMLPCLSILEGGYNHNVLGENVLAFIKGMDGMGVL